MKSSNGTGVVDLPTGNFWADWAGMIASIGCAIHCAAMPLVLAYLPTFGLGWLAAEGFHRWMALICLVLAASAFVPGWRRHRSFLPAIWGAIGLLLLNTAAFGLEDSCCPSCAPDEAAVLADSECTDADCAACTSCEDDSVEDTQLTENVATASSSTLYSLTPYVTPLGGLLLVVGHIINHRKSCGCQGDNCCLSEESGQPEAAVDC